MAGSEEPLVTIDPRDVTVRPFAEQDFAAFCDYWYRSPPGFWDSRAFLWNMMPPEAEFREKWMKRLAEKASVPIPVYTVLYREELVGVHTSTHKVDDESLIMHAHFFFEKFRGKGIGTVSYVKAMERFLTDFNLKEIVFKTPVQNVGPMRIKEKLGMVSVGEEVLDWPQLKPGTRARVFRVSLPQLLAIKQRMGIA